ncbi:hypothetical protein SAMN02910353_00662 [Ruminococcus sp. YRD2003]|uniref:hypothetical protein n=1 Tax=Ruminococcus sp. YRD2003 TaxID=1452313 RepID=UPI0008D19DA3|nr:hypothetical protein SAMN02910353_00662 [Ruminococcus flavefaciens]
MKDNNIKKCKKCGATLVGKKAHKLGLCSHCARDLGQKGAGGLAFGAIILIVGGKVIKTILKRI